MGSSASKPSTTSKPANKRQPVKPVPTKKPAQCKPSVTSLRPSVRSNKTPTPAKSFVTLGTITPLSDQNKQKRNPNYISPRSKPLWVVKGRNSKFTHWDILMMDDTPRAENGVVFGLLSDPALQANFLNCTGATFSGETGTGPLRAGLKLYNKTGRKRQLYDENKRPYFRLPGAVTTEDRLSRACHLVQSQQRYNRLFENCQTFVIEVLKVLHQWDPAMVPKAALDECRRQAMPSVSWAAGDNRKGRTSSRHPRRGHFSSAQEFEDSTVSLAGSSTSGFQPPRAPRNSLRGSSSGN